MLWFIIVIAKFLFKELIYCCQSEIHHDRTSNTFRYMFVSCWTQWLLRLHMCLLLIPLEGKNPGMKKDLWINSSWIWKGQVFLVQLSGRGCLGFPAEVGGWSPAQDKGTEWPFWQRFVFFALLSLALHHQTSNCFAGMGLGLILCWDLSLHVLRTVTTPSFYSTSV